ncbi:hypothetical protein FOL47_010217 [Perkinsus chesapeaki]|uniref:Uncharacterized protein n=1 Tax=Perkinsus chesapeaki TaxID=330153 RepID=A0A7J6L3Y6_PERCH|nr:hypothetical protein FOL47_010217 [Perkinsus chesapeaki]
MFFVHRVANAVTMMYNEADELTVCHFIRPKERAKIRQGLEEFDGHDQHEGALETSETEQHTREEVSVVGEGRLIRTSSSGRDHRHDQPDDEGDQAASRQSIGDSPSRPA